jgi:hypothetical protein
VPVLLNHPCYQLIDDFEAKNFEKKNYFKNLKLACPFLALLQSNMVVLSIIFSSLAAVCLPFDS